MKNPLLKSIVLNFKQSSSDTDNHYKCLSLTYITSHNDTPTVKDVKVKYPNEAIKSYAKWRDNYKKFIALLNHKIKDSKNQSTDNSENQTAQSLKEIEIEVKNDFQDCIKQLNEWFNQINIDDKLTLEKAVDQELRSAQKNKVIITSDDEELQKLLWHRLMKIDDNNKHGNNTGIILAIPSGDTPDNGHKLNIIDKNINVLVIYGDGAKEELNGELEVEEWQNWKKEINESYSASLIEVIKAPESYNELINKFKEKKWDIIYFTGHGDDYPLPFYEQNNSGNYYKIIKLCDKSIPISDFCRILTQNNPELRLVILNCCEGLGLGKELLKGGIHQVVCMREPITQPTALRFIKTFLEEFKNEPCLHIALNKTQIRLSVENDNDIGLGSCSIIALLQNPNVQHLEWHPPYDHSPINTVHNFISRFSTRTITIFTAILIVCCTSAGFLLNFLIIEYFKPSRQAKALSYTFDICLVDDKNKNCETGYFLHKEGNKNNNNLPKFTYQAVVPPSLIEKILQGKNVKIYTQKGEEEAKISRDNLDNYSLLEYKPDYLTLSFQSNNDYDFPNFNPKGFFKIFSSHKTNIKLVAENIVLVYKISKENDKDFDYSVGVLIGKLPNYQNNYGDKKTIYFGYILDPELVQFIISNSKNNFEIHTLKDEKFYDKNIVKDQDNSMVFEYKLMDNNKNIVLFKFSSDKNYNCPEALNNARNLKEIAENYQLESKLSKKK
jgi:hypothetical protein